MSYEFDKGVAIPTTTTRQGINMDLLRAMPVGMSFWFSLKEQKKATRFYRVAKKLDVTILIRKVGKDDPRGAGVRMWRVDPKAAPDPIMLAERAARAPKKAVRKTAVKKAAKKAAPKKAAPKAAATKAPRKPRPSELAKRAAKTAAKGVSAKGAVGSTNVVVG